MLKGRGGLTRAFFPDRYYTMIYGPIRPLARTFVTPSSFVAEDSLPSEILFPTPARSFALSDFCNDAADSEVALHDELRRNFRSAKPAIAT